MQTVGMTNICSQGHDGWCRIGAPSKCCARARTCIPIGILFTHAAPNTHRSVSVGRDKVDDLAGDMAGPCTIHCPDQGRLCRKRWLRELQRGLGRVASRSTWSRLTSWIDDPRAHISQ